MDIEKMMREKPFSTLSEKEREMILAEMTASEYESLRKTALAAEQYFRKEVKTLRPRPAIQGYVRETLRKKQEATVEGRITKLLNLRVPAYQVAAAAALLIATLYFTGKSSQTLYSGDGNHVMIADSTQTDTASQKGINLLEDTVFSRFMMEAL
ncbi:MAG: hypothetical protein SF052_20620 [Bacteroidia bacterium]|nr:hypothetical protein [Bacteroidia bacterium]